MRPAPVKPAALLLGLWLMAVAGCGPSGESPARPWRAREAAQAAPAQGAATATGAAPAYHQPGAWWRAQHSAQLGGAGSLWPWSRPMHSLGECLVCHRPSQSCQPCHAYVGAPAVGEEG